MENDFRFLIPPTQEEINSIWDNAHLVFDTNVLLHIYRLSPHEKQTLLNILNNPSNAIHTPYHTVNEFFKNRFTTIHTSINEADKFKEKILTSITELISIINSNPHPSVTNNTYINTDNLNEMATNFLNEITTTLEKEYPKIDSVSQWRSDENITELTELLTSNIGLPDAHTKLLSDNIENLNFDAYCNQRFDSETPPGFKDAKKETNKFGDIIIWLQTMYHSKTTGKNIIFITSDNKSDWFERQHGKTLGPRIELRQEFHETTGNDIYIYTFNQFLTIEKTRPQNNSQKTEDIESLSTSITEIETHETTEKALPSQTENPSIIWYSTDDSYINSHFQDSETEFLSLLSELTILSETCNSLEDLKYILRFITIIEHSLRKQKPTKRHAKLNSAKRSLSTIKHKTFYAEDYRITVEEISTIYNSISFGIIIQRKKARGTRIITVDTISFMKLLDEEMNEGLSL